jgi:hypothetical protein
VATPWQEFAQVPAKRWTGAGSDRVVVDCWRALGHLAETEGVRYVRLGFGGEERKQLAAQGAQVTR